MNLRLLRYFTETVDAGSATRAAARLHVTQPVLSRQLRQLEQDLGLPLFERQGHRLRLTPAGEQFLPLARNLLRQADEVRRASASIASGRLDQLHLAVPTTTLNDVLAPFLVTLHPDDPVPIVRQLDPRGADAALSSGADLAIVPRPPARHLASHALAVLPIWAQVRRDDEWADRTTVDVGELAERALLLLTADFRPRQLLDEALDGTGLSYREVVECTNARVAQALAAAGRGVAVVSDDPRFDLTPVAVTGPAGPVRSGSASTPPGTRSTTPRPLWPTWPGGWLPSAPSSTAWRWFHLPEPNLRKPWAHPRPPVDFVAVNRA